MSCKKLKKKKSKIYQKQIKTLNPIIHCKLPHGLRILEGYVSLENGMHNNGTDMLTTLLWCSIEMKKIH